jgi:hypothetical protein
MTQDNQISAVISTADQQAIIQDIAAIKEKLSNVLLFNLTPKQRQEMLKMGDKTLAFVEKALAYAAQNPDLVPGYLDLGEANKDYNLANSLYDIYQQIITLSRAIEDTMMVAGAEAYDASLIFYNNVKGAERSNIPGSHAIYEDLKQQFPRNVTKVAAVTPSAN